MQIKIIRVTDGWETTHFGQKEGKGEAARPRKESLSTCRRLEGSVWFTLVRPLGLRMCRRAMRQKRQWSAWPTSQESIKGRFYTGWASGVSQFISPNKQSSDIPKECRNHKTKKGSWGNWQSSQIFLQTDPPNNWEEKVKLVVKDNGGGGSSYNLKENSIPLPKWTLVLALLVMWIRA